jgi:hypothetical protein
LDKKKSHAEGRKLSEISPQVAIGKAVDLLTDWQVGCRPDVLLGMEPRTPRIRSAWMRNNEKSMLFKN